MRVRGVRPDASYWICWVGAGVDGVVVGGVTGIGIDVIEVELVDEVEVEVEVALRVETISTRVDTRSSVVVGFTILATEFTVAEIVWLV